MASQIRPSTAPITAPKGAAGAPPVQSVRKPGAAPQAKPVPAGPVRPVATKPTASSAQEVPKVGVPKAGVPKPQTPPSGQPESQERSLGASILGQAPAWAVSMLLHIVVLLSMALVVSEPPKQEEPRLITSTAPEVAEEFEEFEEQPEQPDDAPETNDAVVMSDATIVEDVQVVSTADDLDAAPMSVELTDFSTETAASSDLLSTVGVVGGKGGGLGGRSGAQRQSLVQSGGGNSQSEAAVEAALKWFIQHQLPDGGWSFDLKECPSCQGQCTHGGEGGLAKDRGGATAMALLPFLGRGYTHKEGPYKAQLERGLHFLASMTVAGNGKAYGTGGMMYSQGIAGIVLSESYAMTQDKRLAIPAQLALNYIMAGQDPVGGGWRYSPKQAGDTSAVGWQLMALKSGNLAYLEVSPIVIKKAVEFLNSAQGDDGATYGYTGPGAGPSTSAVGLLCRMYLGWKKDHPALQRGVERLAKMGPSKDLYFDYYATQILHHMEGDMWVAWNAKMRDMLVTSQATKGHETGSWYTGVDGGHGPHAVGRIYCTSLATMILEVYYRHLPIYGQQSVDEDFKE